MSISSNYGLMQKQIADELEDNQALLAPLDVNSGLLSPIQNSIQSAISKWEREIFYFNGYRLKCEPTSAFKLAAGQEYYSSADFAPIGTLACIKSITILQGSQNRFTLDERTSIQLDEWGVNMSWRGMPTDYSFEVLQLRIYPIPDVIYPVGLLGTQRLPALALPADTNAWMQDAFDLIKSDAKLTLAREVIYDEKIEASMLKAIYGDPMQPRDRGYLKALKDETTRRHSSRTKVRPTYF